MISKIEFERNKKLIRKHKLPYSRIQHGTGSSVGKQVRIRNKRYKDLEIPKGLTDDQLQDYILNVTKNKEML